MAILTGPEIRKQIEGGDIKVDPYLVEHVGPNSMDLRLHESLGVYNQFWPAHLAYSHTPRKSWPGWSEKALKKLSEAEASLHATPLDMRSGSTVRELVIPETGLVLYPGILYLGRTVERLGSDVFVPIVEGRSSMGRLGVQVHVTAGFCDLGFHGTITLEITVVHPIRVYAGERVCQVYFTRAEGDVELYSGRYQGQEAATGSRMHLKDGDW
jgi:dCTP deaminase